MDRGSWGGFYGWRLGVRGRESGEMDKRRVSE